MTTFIGNLIVTLCIDATHLPGDMTLSTSKRFLCKRL